MKIKKDFELIYQTDGKMFNLYPYKGKTLNPYLVNNDDLQYLKIMIKTQNRGSKNEKFNFLTEKYLNKTLFVKIEEYPLPGFMLERENDPVINLSVFGNIAVSDISPIDIYSAFIYSSSFTNFCVNKKISKQNIGVITDFYLACFVYLFGKKSGLLGAYSNLIPSLKLLISLYVQEGLFGDKVSEKEIRKYASFYGVKDWDKMKFDFNWSSTIEFLKSINKNKILPISENVFSNKIISVAEITSLPMFEDASRLFATILAIGIFGNHLFSTYWLKKIRELYYKLFVISNDLIS